MPRRPRGGVEVLVYYFLNLGARWGSVVNATLRPLYPGERDTVPIGQDSKCCLYDFGDSQYQNNLPPDDQLHKGETKCVQGD